MSAMSVSNHQSYDCLLNRLFRCRSTKTSKTGGFPAHMASNADSATIWWYHHGEMGPWTVTTIPADALARTWLHQAIGRHRAGYKIRHICLRNFELPMILFNNSPDDVFKFHWSCCKPVFGWWLTTIAHHLSQWWHNLQMHMRVTKPLWVIFPNYLIHVHTWNVVLGVDI